MTIIFDIDGTLSEHQKKWDDPVPEMIEKVKKLIADGHIVIIWTSTTRYARAFCEKHGLKPTLACAKPDMIVDNETEKWGNKLKGRTIHPDEFRRRYDTIKG